MKWPRMKDETVALIAITVITVVVGVCAFAVGWIAGERDEYQSHIQNAANDIDID